MKTFVMVGETLGFKNTTIAPTYNPTVTTVYATIRLVTAADARAP